MLNGEVHKFQNILVKFDSFVQSEVLLIVHGMV
jgi:hypothetical protein